jgi:hypothetical protein
MKLPILFFLLILISISFISANNSSIGSWSNVKQLDCADLSLVSLSESCNITSIRFPNKSIAVSNIIMSNNAGEFNYTFCKTYSLGTYEVKGFCNEPWTNTFDVTTTGQKDFNTLPLFLLLGGFIIFGFASYLKNEYIGLLSGFLFIVAGVYMMIYGLGIFLDMYTRAIAFITLGIGLMVCFIAMVEMFYTDLGIMGGRDED